MTRRTGLKLALGAIAAAAFVPFKSLLRPATAFAAVDPCETNLFTCLNAVEPDVKGILDCVLPVPIPSKDPVLKQLYEFVKGKAIEKVVHKVPILGQAECFAELAYANAKARNGCYDSFTQCSGPDGGGAPPPSPPVSAECANCEKVGGQCCGTPGAEHLCACASPGVPCSRYGC